VLKPQTPAPSTSNNPTIFVLFTIIFQHGPSSESQAWSKVCFTMYVLFFFVVACVGVIGEVWTWLLMAPTCFQCARARLAPARARRVPCYHFSTWTFNLILSSLFSPHHHPLTCFPLLLGPPAPFRPRCQHPATHGTTPPAWPLCG
jgi:hypothetical protein